jgi:phosphonate transport system substrate-binding protein
MRPTSDIYTLSFGRLSNALMVSAFAIVVSSASPVLAGWRDEMKSFRLGMVARDEASQAVPGLSILERAYSMALGVKAEIFVARDYAALIDAQATGRVDYAIYSTAAYATAELLCSCVEPVIAPVGDDGATGLVAVLITRDDRIPALADVAEHRVAIAPADSVAGSMLPEFELAGAKMILTGSEPYLVRAESASAAEAMLVDGSVDAIFGWATAHDTAGARPAGGTLDRLVAGGLDRASLKVVWTSQPVRYGPHALRTGLDAEVRTILVNFLTDLKEQQPDVYDLLESDHGGGFVEVGPQDYAAAVEMIRRVGSGNFGN